ncbi:hypothetical protein EES47_16335 [Streptomyces sp. ADI98-12]|uniref:Uncharacterized protein n=1 Tax=Streptomyces griseus TaxID=1911 RepID=A0A380P507_STRGR|nr:hypothetical protein [Streptomyces sp. DSM 41037]RPK87831.1 hypothetical protein EES47_16335 [Streptomyces sp. ADI98-12]SUP60303.1 Uncharacterised protein [Streptomyces griseus]
MITIATAPATRAARPASRPLPPSPVTGSTRTLRHI